MEEIPEKAEKEWATVISEFDDEQLLSILSDRRNILDEFGRLSLNGDREHTRYVSENQIERLLDQYIIERVSGHWVHRDRMRPYFDETHYELTDLGYHTLDYLRQKAANDWRMMQPENMQSAAERKAVIDAFMDEIGKGESEEP